MSEEVKAKRSFWRIHLLTAIVMTAQTGLLIPMFIEVYDSDRNDRVVLKIAVYSLLVICFSMVVVENIVRAFQRKLIQFVAGVAVILLGGLITHWMTAPIRIASNYRRAVAVCRNFAEAEEIYHRLDYVGSGCLSYAQHLGGSDQYHSLFGRELIPSELANADISSAHPVPWHGYFYKILTAQGEHATGGRRSYLVHSNLISVNSTHTNTGECDPMVLGYALLAFPSEYPINGVNAFMINGNGTVYEKDLGPNAAKIASGMIEFDPDPSWKPVD